VNRKEKRRKNRDAGRRGDWNPIVPAESPVGFLRFRKVENVFVFGI